MANDTIPLPEISRACYQVLSEKLLPMHYTDLTKLGLGKLGLTDKDVNWQRQIEDVREKMLQASYRDTFYIGQPYCLGGIRWWFETRQLRIFHPTHGVIIPGNASSGRDGAFEALMRDPYLKIKKTDQHPCLNCGQYQRPTWYDRVAKGRANGFVIERHVADWFKLLWPEFYLPPDNQGNWRQFCQHDFKLRLDNTTYEVDVTGPRQNGTFGNPGQGKGKVTFHLVCEITGQDVLWRSVIPGNKYNHEINPDSDGSYPEKMIVWLNCRKWNVDYKGVRSALLPGNQRLTAVA